MWIELHEVRDISAHAAGGGYSHAGNGCNLIERTLNANKTKRRSRGCRKVQEQNLDVTILLILAVASVVFLMLVLWLLGSLLKKVPPNQALITYGRGGVSVVTGGAAWVWPIFQRSATFSLEL